MSAGKQALLDALRDHPGEYNLIPTMALLGLQGEPAAFMVYAYLFSQAEEWNPSQRQIQDATGLSRCTVIRAIQTLEEHGLIARSRALKEKNEYTLLPVV